MRVLFPSYLPESLKKKLQNINIATVEIPLIKTVPIDFKTDIDFSKFDFIIFSSKNGVKHFFLKISPSTIKNCKIIAVGKSTAKKLKEFGIEAEIPDKFSGEGLIYYFSDKNIQNKKFLTVRPKVAREIFKEFIQEKGASAEEIIVYETVTNTEEREKLLRAFSKPIDIIVFTSPSTFKSFLNLSGETGKTSLKKCKIIPIGDVTAKAIINSGFNIWKIPTEFTLSGIVDTIIENTNNLEET